MRAWRQILIDVGSLLDLCPAKLPVSSEFDKELQDFSRDRLSDHDMVLADLRRVMLDELGTLPEHERTRIESELRPDARYSFEERLGLGTRRPAADVGDDQLSLPFAARPVCG